MVFSYRADNDNPILKVFRREIIEAMKEGSKIARTGRRPTPH
jgi:hypothetical protein